MAAITYPIIALRFISRWVVANKFWWDDACVGFATVCTSLKGWCCTAVTRDTDIHDAPNCDTNPEYFYARPKATAGG
jgi:hypothetical protein